MPLTQGDGCLSNEIVPPINIIRFVLISANSFLKWDLGLVPPPVFYF